VTVQKSMNIGFYRYSLLNRGGDRMVIEYANDLAQHGNLVTFHVSVLDTVLDIDPKITIKKNPWQSKFGFMLNGLSRSLGHDLVIVDIIHLPLLLALRNKVMYFAQADDVEYYDNCLLRWMMHLLYWIFFKLGGKAITVSDYLTQAFQERYGVTNIHTVTNGIDLGTFYPEPDQELLIQKAARKSIFFMARGDHFRKGHDLAMEVLATIPPESATSFELWVCGNHLDVKEFPFLVRNFGVVSDSRLRQLLSSADIFFYPSRHEGFGLFPLESMACGCTVVTTDAIPYARDFDCILTSEIGNVCGMRDDLLKFLRDSRFLSEAKLTGMQVARKFDLVESKRAFLQVVESIVLEIGS
jgi:glycosyltransferase involved in cell wall biosynthesis